MKRKLSILILAIMCFSLLMGSFAIATDSDTDTSSDSSCDTETDSGTETITDTSNTLITPDKPTLTPVPKFERYYIPVYELSEDGTYYTVTSFKTVHEPTEEALNANTIYVPDTYNGLPVKCVMENALTSVGTIKNFQFSDNIAVFSASGNTYKATEFVGRYYTNSKLEMPEISLKQDIVLNATLKNDTANFASVCEIEKYKGEDIYVFSDDEGNKTYFNKDLEDITEEYEKSYRRSVVLTFTGTALAATVTIIAYCTCRCKKKDDDDELPPPDNGPNPPPGGPNPPPPGDPNPPPPGGPNPPPPGDPNPPYPSPNPPPDEPNPPPPGGPNPPPPKNPWQKYGCLVTIIISITFIFSVGAPFLSLIHDTSMWLPATISSASALLIYGANAITKIIPALDKLIPYRRGTSTFISLVSTFFILGTLGYWHPGWSMIIVATICATITIGFTVFLPKVFIKIAYFRIGISLFIFFTGYLFSFGIIGMWKEGFIIYAIGALISIICAILEFVFKKFILKSLVMRI